MLPLEVAQYYESKSCTYIGRDPRRPGEARHDHRLADALAKNRGPGV